MSQELLPAAFCRPKWPCLEFLEHDEQGVCGAKARKGGDAHEWGLGLRNATNRAGRG
jgi:hypothetical protein